MKDLLEGAPAFFAPAWCFALGIAAGYYPLSLDWRLRLALALLSIIILIGLLFSGMRGPRIALALALCLGALLGVFLALGEAGRPSFAAQGVGMGAPDKPAGGYVRTLRVVGVEAVLASDSRPARGGLRSYDLELSGVYLAAPGMRARCEARGGLRALVREGPSLASGAQLRVDGELGATGLFFANSGSLLVRSEGDALARTRNRVHEGFIAALGLAVRGRAGPSGDRGIEDEAGLLIALLSGWQDQLSPAIEAAFRGAGCTHILALSGQHLALIAAGLALLLRPLLGPRRSLIPVLCSVGLYVVVVGPGPSLLRSLISFGLAAVATLLDRPQDGRSPLGLCFRLHALLFPADLREAGYVLSYLAVGGLVVLGPRFEYLLAPLCPPPLSSAFSASLAAQAATSPWIAIFFGVFQPVGILATVLTATLVEGLMIFGLVSALLASVVPALALLTSPLTRLLLHSLIAAMDFFARLPSLTLVAPEARIAVAVAVAAFALFIYARPHADYRRARRSWEERRGGRVSSP